MSTIQGVCHSALPWADQPPGAGYSWRDVSGFPPCRLYFPGAPTTGTVSAIYSTGNALCAGTLYAAGGAPLARIESSNKEMAVSYSGGAPTFIAQTGSSIFVVFGE